MQGILLVSELVEAALTKILLLLQFGVVRVYNDPGGGGPLEVLSEQNALPLPLLFRETLK